MPTYDRTSDPMQPDDTDFEESARRSLKKKKAKLDRHFDIIIDGQRHKILRFDFEQFGGRPRLHLTSKVRFRDLARGESDIHIDHGGRSHRIRGRWKFGHDSPGLWKVCYSILEHDQAETDADPVNG